MTDYKPIDLGPDCHDWQTIGELAGNIGVSESSIYMALKDGRKTGGYALEEREPDDDLRAELGIDGRIKRVVRVVRDEGVLGEEALRRAEERIARESTPLDDLVTIAVEAERVADERDAALETVKSLEDELIDAQNRITELENDLGCLRSAGSDVKLQNVQEHSVRLTTKFADLEDAAWSILTGDVCLSEAKQHLAKVLRSLR